MTTVPSVTLSSGRACHDATRMAERATMGEATHPEVHGLTLGLTLVLGRVDHLPLPPGLRRGRQGLALNCGDLRAGHLTAPWTDRLVLTGLPAGEPGF